MFRVKLTTTDGVLVQNRESESGFWFTASGKLDVEFARISLEADCREKGVRLISYTANQSGVDGIVTWL